MKLNTVKQIFRALNDARVRYLGVHGYLRFNKDVDLVLQMEANNIERAFAALTELGFRPNVPITGRAFADPARREGWIRGKCMQLLQLWSDVHQETPVAIFVTEPFPFEEEYERALLKPLAENIEVRFVSIPILIKMKQAANREQDRIDIEHLRLIQKVNDG